MATKAPEPENYAKALHQSIAQWFPSFASLMTARQDGATVVIQDGQPPALILVLFRGDKQRIQTSIPINIGGDQVLSGDALVAWGFVQLDIGTWLVTPSVNHAEYHGFVIVRGVPFPPPFPLAVPAALPAGMKEPAK